MFLLQKMGWSQGQGLGKNNEGEKLPLMLDIKVDRKGKRKQMFKNTLIFREMVIKKEDFY